MDQEGLPVTKGRLQKVNENSFLNKVTSREIFIN
jgi:hypothetical protein